MIRARSGKTAGRLLLGAGVLALLIPAIAGCEAGNDAPTLQFHSASAGANGTVDNIRISNAFVLGAPSGATVPAGSSAGLFVSLYNGGNSSDTLLKATTPAGSVSFIDGSVSLPANAAPVNLTGPQPKVVVDNLTKPLNGGSSIPVVFEFQHAGTVKLQVPVMSQNFYYATFSPPAAGSGGTQTPDSSATAPALGSGDSGGSGSTSGGSASSTPTATP